MALSGVYGSVERSERDEEDPDFSHGLLDAFAYGF